MRAPGGDAFKMRIVNVTWPPGQTRRPTCKFGYMLTGAAAGFQHIARLRQQESRYCRPDRFMVAVIGRTVQAAIGRGRVGVFAVLDDEFGHGDSWMHLENAIRHGWLAGSKPLAGGKTSGNWFAFVVFSSVIRQDAARA